jgi:hypothetical protein
MLTSRKEYTAADAQEPVHGAPAVFVGLRCVTSRTGQTRVAKHGGQSHNREGTTSARSPPVLLTTTRSRRPYAKLTALKNSDKRLTYVAF